MIPLGVYVRHNQPEQYRNWVMILMQNGYPIPRWNEWGGVSGVKESRTTEKEFTPFQRMIDKMMKYIPKGAKTI